MKAYLGLLHQALTEGLEQENRTGIDTLSIPGAHLRYDLREGFPAVTTKKLAFKSVVGELVGFLRGVQSAAQFRALGCRVWDQNANENEDWLNNPYRKGEDDLGPVYGAQWRNWPAYKTLKSTESKQIEDAIHRGYQVVGGEGDDVILYKSVDQLAQCIQTIINDPGSRRILFHGWNPAVLDQIALPACHLLYQFLPHAKSRTLSMTLYIRSNDLGLGLPFNQASAAAMLHLVARLTNYQAAWLNIFIGDAHIYSNHIQMIKEQLTREPFPLPALHISDRVQPISSDESEIEKALLAIEPSDFTLEGYQHHTALRAPMAV